MLTGLVKSASFDPLLNLHNCITLVKLYRFKQCLGWRFSPISTFFSLVCSRAFKDASHSRFRLEDPNQCLPNFLKMLLLALLKSTHVRFSWGSLLIWTVLKVAETGLRAAWFWPTLGQHPETWAIFPIPKDSKLIWEDFGFQWNGQWTLGYEQSNRNIAT